MGTVKAGWRPNEPGGSGDGTGGHGGPHVYCPGRGRYYFACRLKHLVSLATDLGVSEHVRFVDTYLTEAELTDYLLASDVYITPYLGEDQIVSGTLAYALGLGKAIVSTPYLYARELLAGTRGLLVEFRNAQALEQAVKIGRAHV